MEKKNQIVYDENKQFFIVNVAHKIPIIQLLMKGGPLSVLRVCGAIKHQTPVLVIQVCLI